MLWIRNVLVSEELLEEYFHCDLDRCKGACCIRGDFGAPLDREEIASFKENWDVIRGVLTDQGVEAVRLQGFSVRYDDRFDGTPLKANESCAFAIRSEDGCVRCGIEEAASKTDRSFQKPISCHLYPVRAIEMEAGEMEALNYDRWDICSPACAKGGTMKQPLYRFVKEALIKKYGLDFYRELEEIAAAKSRS